MITHSFVPRGALGLALIGITVSILCLITAVLVAQPASAQQEPSHPFGDPTAPLAERHVYDFANTLDEAEIASIESDANRLQRHGIPAVIITVNADLSPEDAARVAGATRQDWDIATSPGADDGLVFLVVIPGTDQGDTYATLSWGVNALPHEGLSVAVSEQVYQQWVGMWLGEPQVYEAVTYGLRRLIYHVIYDPAPEEPLSGTREAAHTILAWLAPLIVIGAGVLRFTRLGEPFRAGKLPALPGWVVELGPFLLALLLAIASIWAQSEIGVACTGVLLVAALFLWIRRDTAPRCSTGSGWSPVATRDGA